MRFLPARWLQVEHVYVLFPPRQLSSITPGVHATAAVHHLCCNPLITVTLLQTEAGRYAAAGFSKRWRQSFSRFAAVYATALISFNWPERNSHLGTWQELMFATPTTPNTGRVRLDLLLGCITVKRTESWIPFSPAICTNSYLTVQWTRCKL